MSGHFLPSDGPRNIPVDIGSNSSCIFKNISGRHLSPMKKCSKFDDEPRRKKKKKKNQNKNEKMRNIIINIEKEIEEQLDTKTEENDFTTTNVKGILKELIMDEDMKEMVRQTLHPGDCARCYEPKLTRAKVRKLLELRPDLKIPILWPIQQNNTNFVSECLSLINEDYSENSSEDEEYRPDDDKDHDANVSVRCESDIRGFNLSPNKSLDVEAEPACAGNSRRVDKVEENIGQRTRSKLPLTETRLEDIEQTFNPPDITLDMYDCDIDNEDYLNFLREFNASYDCENVETADIEDDLDNDPEYRIPNDAETVDREELRRDESTEVPPTELWQLINEIIGNNEAMKTVTERKKLLEMASVEPESRPDKSVKSTPATTIVDMQTSAVILPTETVVNPNEIVSKLPKASCLISPSKNVDQSESNHSMQFELEQREEEAFLKNSDPNIGPALTKQQKLLFEQQLRQHIQLTTMHFLQCYKNGSLHPFAEELKNLLVTIQLLAKSNEKSAYFASNLNDALKLIDDWEKMTTDNSNFETNSVTKKKRAKKSRSLSSDVMKVACKSKVFLYPLLLPDRPFCDYLEKPVHRREITKSQEWLLAIGLQQFHEFVLSNKQLYGKKNIMRETLKLIVHYLLPNFTPSYLHYVLKKKSSDDPNDSCIKYYLEHKNAPPLKHFVVPVQPIPLYKQPFDLLPKIWLDYITENFVVMKRR